MGPKPTYLIRSRVYQNERKWSRGNVYDKGDRSFGKENRQDCTHGVTTDIPPLKPTMWSRVGVRDGVLRPPGTLESVPTRPSDGRGVGVSDGPTEVPRLWSPLIFLGRDLFCRRVMGGEGGQRCRRNVSVLVQ